MVWADVGHRAVRIYAQEGGTRSESNLNFRQKFLLAAPMTGCSGIDDLAVYTTLLCSALQSLVHRVDGCVRGLAPSPAERFGVRHARGVEALLQVVVLPLASDK